MSRPTSPRLILALLVHRAAARRATVAAGAARVPFRRGAAVAVAAIALAGPAAAQSTPIPQGGEFRVNTTTTDNQQDASVARDADGDFVVVWHGNGPGDPAGVFAQRYAASGAAVGPEFLVNTFTTSFQRNASVAIDADGDFIVAWLSRDQDGSLYGVYAQRYTSSAVSVGGEFQVNEYTTNSQRRASVAVDADGDFVVAWQSLGQDGSQGGGYAYGVYARRYAASGAPVGGEFRVNDYTTGAQRSPDVAVDADGDFVVAWQSLGQDGDGYGVYARRYAASGAPVGAETRVNTVTTSGQSGPSVAVDADGDVVVAWTSFEQDGSSSGVFAQRYATSGAAVGAEVRVNTFTTGTQTLPSVAVDADGDVVVAWQSLGQDGDSYGIYAQQYAASGAPVGGEFRVNTFTTQAQRSPAAALDADGDVVVVWRSTDQDGSGEGVYAQRYATSTVASEPGAPSGLTLGVVPSPVSAGGTVRVSLPEAGVVRVAVYDVLGRQVAVLADGERAAGTHDVALDASRFAPGVYIVRLTAGEASVVRRVTVAR